MSDTSPIGNVVDKLDALLTEETEALRRLDHETLNRITDQKIDLLNRLKIDGSVGVSPEVAAIIAGLRDRILTNQILMAHARELTQGVIDEFTGHGKFKDMPGARLLEVRG